MEKKIIILLQTGLEYETYQSQVLCSTMGYPCCKCWSINWNHVSKQFTHHWMLVYYLYVCCLKKEFTLKSCTCFALYEYALLLVIWRTSTEDVFSLMCAPHPLWHKQSETVGKELESAIWTRSKHWFTTSFLQPLPYLVTSYVPENCQLTSSFSLVLKQW